jgi:hypothetical protein
MTVSLIRLDQQHSPDVFDDTKSAASIALAETASVDYADFQEYVLSQLKRIIHGDDAGNWHDDIATVFTTPHSLKALGQHTTLDDKQIVLWKMLLQDITVTAAQNFEELDQAGEFPSEVIAILAATNGAVSAQLAGAVGSHSLTEIAGQNALKPKNLVAIFDASSGDPIMSDNRRIWGLLQVGAAATDGNAFAATGNDAAQISFVRQNATFDDLEACPVADIAGKSINYSYTVRNDMASFAEDAWRGDLSEADQIAGGFGGLDAAYDGGEFMEVDASDVDIRLADTKSWVVRKGSGGAILWQVTRTDAGTADVVQIAGAVDTFDVDAADSDFLQGATFDSGGQSINVGTTALGVIDSTSIELRATTGNAEVAAPSGEVQFQTVRETTALPLDDATTGAISALKTVLAGAGTFISVADAIKYAAQQGGVDLSLKIFVAASNYAQGANIPAATFDLTAYSIDMNTPANVDAFIFLNGRLLHGGNVTVKNDVYVGSTASAGDLAVDFPKGIKSGDVLISIGLQQ